MKMMCALVWAVPLGIGLALLTQDVGHLIAAVDR